jgi:hypothetical protein
MKKRCGNGAGLAEIPLAWTEFQRRRTNSSGSKSASQPLTPPVHQYGRYRELGNSVASSRISPYQCQVHPRSSLLVQLGVRTSCVECEERIEQRWETAKWLGLPGRNVLIEAYRSPADPKEHKRTAHYQTRCDTASEIISHASNSPGPFGPTAGDGNRPLSVLESHHAWPTIPSPRTTPKES